MHFSRLLLLKGWREWMIVWQHESLILLLGSCCAKHTNKTPTGSGWMTENSQPTVHQQKASMI